MSFIVWAVFQVSSALVMMLWMAWTSSENSKTGEREIRLPLGVSSYVGSKCLTLIGVWIVVNLQQVHK